MTDLEIKEPFGAKASPKEMIVKEGITYEVGEFECPQCHEHHVIKCNPKGKKRRHWIE